MRPNDYLLAFALERGLVSSTQATEAETAVGSRGALARLQADHALSGRRLAALLAEQFALPLAELSAREIPAGLLEQVPSDYAREHRLLPLQGDDRALHVAVDDPSRTDGVDALSALLGREVLVQVAASDELDLALDRHYGRDAGILSPEPEGEGPTADSVGRLREPDGGDASDGDAPVSSLVQGILERAIRRGVSDIHFEPLESHFRVRCRLDGVLIESDRPPQRLQAAIISRLKIMANLSIAEKRIPQDGRLRFPVGGRTCDLRVSSLPTAHGESVVMRVLDREELKTDFGELGLEPADRRRLARLIRLPEGLLLVTGPTGSGKTTTLYSCLQQLNGPDRKIITVEDPVEYQLEGINHVAVRSDIGMTFAAALRAMLRQAPNVVMVGEIRDRETAEVAVNASLTGHLVFSTLHTNDAPGAIVRLLDMGVPSFLLATAMRAVLAQRLVRRICPSCSRPHAPDSEALRRLGIAPADAATADFRKGEGCPACQGTGFRGRIGLFEFLTIDEELQSMIHRRAAKAALCGHARLHGWRTLREDGRRKVLAGMTTVEEVGAITVDDLI